MSSPAARTMRFVKHLIAGAVVLAGSASSASATILELTTAGTSGFINTAFFQQIAPSSTGTGVIDSFVRLEDATPRGIEVEGFNTDGIRYYDELGGVFTHSLLLSAVPEVTIGGVVYYQFLLDINQTGSDPLLSLYELQVLLGATGSPTGPSLSSVGTLSLSSGGTLIYDLDAGSDGDSYIDLNYNLNTGSGSGDMFFYMPKPAGINEAQFLYLYSKFGIPNDNNDGFEEWAILKAPTGGSDTETPVPEPGSMILLGSGLVLVASRLRRKRS